MLLHGAYNTAIGLLILVPEDSLRRATYAGVTVAITGTMLAVTAVLLVVTRGRLGLDAGANAQTWLGTPACSASEAHRQ